MSVARKPYFEATHVQYSIKKLIVVTLKIIFWIMLCVWLVQGIFSGTPKTRPKDPCSDEYRDIERCNEIDIDQYEISM